MKTPAVLVLNGPNLNLLGTREPELYGAVTLAEIERMCIAEGARLGLAVSCLQSNHEGVLVDAVQTARDTQDGIVLNAAAYTHTSVALLDALKMFEKPVIELHLTNIHKREAFRHHSFVSQAATAMICGFGADGYRLALSGLATILKAARPSFEPPS